MTDGMVATANLRWVERTPDPGVVPAHRVLQQYFAQDMPGYMRAPGVGEWRDVPVVEDTE